MYYIIVFGIILTVLRCRCSSSFSFKPSLFILCVPYLPSLFQSFQKHCDIIGRCVTKISKERELHEYIVLVILINKNESANQQLCFLFRFSMKTSTAAAACGLHSSSSTVEKVGAILFLSLTYHVYLKLS